MDRPAAVAEAERLNREDDERHRFRWSVREVAQDEWEVVRFEIPGAGRSDFKPGVGTKPYRPDPGELPAPQTNPYWGTG